MRLTKIIILTERSTTASVNREIAKLEAEGYELFGGTGNLTFVKHVNQYPDAPRNPARRGIPEHWSTHDSRPNTGSAADMRPVEPTPPPIRITTTRNPFLFWRK